MTGLKIAPPLPPVDFGASNSLVWGHASRSRDRPLFLMHSKEGRRVVFRNPLTTLMSDRVRRKSNGAETRLPSRWPKILAARFPLPAQYLQSYVSSRRRGISESRVQCNAAHVLNTFSGPRTASFDRDTLKPQPILRIFGAYPFRGVCTMTR